MKLSLAWIFDHIDADWKQQSVDEIYKKFNAITAEIESVEHLSIDLSPFFLGKVVGQAADGSFTLDVPELAQQVSLAAREGAEDLIAAGTKDLYFLVKKKDGNFSWAFRTDFGLDKAKHIPALDATDKFLDGSWRELFEHEDVLIEVDNKSITHRPDMWGHRGFAREIASFLDLPLKDEAEFLAAHPVKIFEKFSESTSSNPIEIHNKAQGACKKFTGIYFSEIENRPTNIFILSRLLKVGSPPINGIVDLTNYLTTDWSQPVHAYDAAKLEGKKVVVRMADQGEKMLLLSGDEIELTTQDMVIADAVKPACLAGVKGGMHSGVGSETKAIFFESANFDATTVRRTAFRQKTRTDSSARFEKTLDPEQALQGVQRFLKLLEQFNFKASYADEILAVGKETPALTIEVSHDFLEKRSGLVFTPEQVQGALTKIGFTVSKHSTAEYGESYKVIVPTFRASKDVKIKEDILEEVVRLFGFEKVPLELPNFTRRPFDYSWVMRRRKIKQYMASGARMTEQQNYAMYDESFLTLLGFTPQNAIEIRNPVSENSYRMVTSLIPGLLKNIKENHVGRDKLAFFELSKTWGKKGDEPVEQKTLSGVFFDKRSAIDFYGCKQQINGLFSLLGFDEATVSWEKTLEVMPSWANTFEAASIKLDGKIVGVAGKVDKVMLSKLDIIEGADAFIFELNADVLLTKNPQEKRMRKVSKYQETSFDISMMAPLELAAAQIKKAFDGVHDLVYKVDLIDFFEKEAWADKRSLTYRFWMSHAERNLEKEDIDDARGKALEIVSGLGAELRA